MLLAVGRPGRVVVERDLVGQALDVLAVGVGGVDFLVAVARADPGEALAVGRPARRLLERLVRDQHLAVAAVGVDGVDLQLAVGALEDVVGRRRSSCRRATSGRRSAACSASGRSGFRSRAVGVHGPQAHLAVVDAREQEALAVGRPLQVLLELAVAASGGRRPRRAAHAQRHKGHRSKTEASSATVNRDSLRSSVRGVAIAVSAHSCASAVRTFSAFRTTPRSTFPSTATPEGLRLLAGDADGVVDGGGQVGGRHRAVVRVLAAGVAGADDAAAAHAAAGDQGAVAMLPVVAAGLVVDLRRPAELAHRHHQRRAPAGRARAGRPAAPTAPGRARGRGGPA